MTRVLHCDDDGDGRADRTVTVPMPIFHVLGMLSDLGDRYWVLPDRTAGGHVVSGFASRDDRGVVRVLLYAHHAAGHAVALGGDVRRRARPRRAGRDRARVTVREYRFDRDHNSPFRLARTLRDRPAPAGRSDPARQASAMRALEGGDPAAQRAGPGDAAGARPRGPAGRRADPDEAGRRGEGPVDPRGGPRHHPQGDRAPRPTPGPRSRRSSGCASAARPARPSRPREADGRLRLTVKLAGNGCTFLIIEPGG